MGVCGDGGWPSGGQEGREMVAYGELSSRLCRLRLSRVLERGCEIMTVYASRHAHCSSTGNEATRRSASSIQLALSKKRCSGGKPQAALRARQRRLDGLGPARRLRDIDGHGCSGRRIGDWRRFSSSEMDIIPLSQD